MSTSSPRGGAVEILSKASPISEPLLELDQPDSLSDPEIESVLNEQERQGTSVSGGCGMVIVVENALEDDMRRLAELPLLAVVLVCITWVLLGMFVPLLWMSIQMRRQMAILERTGGVETMAVQVDGLMVLLPPLAFSVAWFIARHRARRAVARREE